MKAEFLMTNDECRRKPEGRMPKERTEVEGGWLSLWISDFIRYSSFVIRHFPFVIRHSHQWN